VDAINRNIETPDKANAYLFAEMLAKMTDTDPDYAALTIASMIFGGNPNSRLFQRIRVKEGLSYSVQAFGSVPAKDDAASFMVMAIAAPQNMPKVEAALQEEWSKVLKDGFTADEVEKAKKTWLDQQTVARTEDASITSLLMTRERWGRTMDWDTKLETAVAALTPQQVNEAFRRHVDPAALSIVKGGDFKKANAYR
jgi:zinc protease